MLWSGITGARDADGETSLWVEATPERVTEYQTAAQVTRCDGQPPRLFPRAYDFATGKFRPIISALPPPAPTTLVARRGDPAMPAGAPLANFHFIGASTSRGASDDARALTAPIELNDGNPGTAWAEGLGGDGRGEFLTARAAATGYAVRGLRIFPGDGASLAALRAHNRVKKLQVAFGPAPEQHFDVEMADDPASNQAHWRDPYWVAFPKPVSSACLTVILTAVTPGTDAAPPKNFGTTAMGDLAVFTDADGPGGAERLVADLASAPDCASRLPLLLGLGEAAVMPTAQAVAASAGPGRACLLDALTRLEPAPKSPAVIDALVAAVLGADDEQERAIQAALARAPAPPVAGLAALVASKTTGLADRARAARVLGKLNDDAAADALLAAVGDGPAALRGAVVGALETSPRLRADPILAAYAAAPRGATDPGARVADLARLLPATVKAAPARRADAVGALRADLVADRPFELRGRAIMALAALGDGPTDLASAARAAGDEPVLRFLATRELGERRSEAGDPRPALREALKDGDPRVRETAAHGLAKVGDGGAGGLLIAGAKQEPWPFVRRAELDALGHLCVAGAGDLMIRATEKDVDEVRRAALRRPAAVQGSARPRRAAGRAEPPRGDAVPARAGGRPDRRVRRPQRRRGHGRRAERPGERVRGRHGPAGRGGRCPARPGPPGRARRRPQRHRPGRRRPPPVPLDGHRGARHPVRPQRQRRAPRAGHWERPGPRRRSAASRETLRPEVEANARTRGRQGVRIRTFKSPDPGVPVSWRFTYPSPASAAFKSTLRGSTSRPRSNMLRALGSSLARTCMRPSIR